jgi:hypothetical protein
VKGIGDGAGIETQLHHDWEIPPMNHLFRAAVCFALLCLLPAVVTAQGLDRRGVADPRAGQNNDERNDRIFIPSHMPIHLPSGAGAFGPETPERVTQPPFSEGVKIPPSPEHAVPSPRIASEVHLPPSGMGRGLAGIIGGGFACIAGILRGLFGRRKE